MTNLFKQSLISTISFLFVMTFSSMTMATENPFGMSSVDANQITVAESGKCGGDKKGEGKCGGDKKGKCGGDKKAEGKKGKCGEGKCGGK